MSGGVSRKISWNCVAVFVCISDKLGEVCDFSFASHVVERALFYSAVCRVDSFRWGAVNDVKG